MSYSWHYCQNHAVIITFNTFWPIRFKSSTALWYKNISGMSLAIYCSNVIHAWIHRTPSTPTWMHFSFDGIPLHHLLFWVWKWKPAEISFSSNDGQGETTHYSGRRCWRTHRHHCCKIHLLNYRLEYLLYYWHQINATIRHCWSFSWPKLRWRLYKCASLMCQFISNNVSLHTYYTLQQFIGHMMGVCGIKQANQFFKH